MARLPLRVAETVAEYRSRLEAEMPSRVRRVTVFGSVARMQANEDSDVDVLVVIEPLAPRERARAIDLGTEVGLERGLVIEPLVLSSEEWQALVDRRRALAEEISREGIDA